MRIILIVYIFLFCSLFELTGQWDPTMSQYMNNQLSFNPGYAGVRNTIFTNINTRKQWMGINDSPTSYQLSFHAPINKTFTSLGTNMAMYKTGILTISNANFVYSHLVKLNKQLFLSLGINVGAINHSIDLSNIKLVNTSDPMFQGQTVSQINLDVGFGGWLYSPSFYLGLSMPHALHTEFANEYSIPFYKRNLYLTGGYNFQIGKILAIKPSVLIRGMITEETVSDLSILVEYKSKIELGFTNRLKKSMVVLTNFWVTEKLGIGYSFDIGNSQHSISNSSHEISVKLRSF